MKKWINELETLRRQADDLYAFADNLLCLSRHLEESEDVAAVCGILDQIILKAGKIQEQAKFIQNLRRI